MIIEEQMIVNMRVSIMVGMALYLVSVVDAIEGTATFYENPYAVSQYYCCHKIK